MRMFKILDFIQINNYSAYRKYSLTFLKKELSLIRWNPESITKLHDHQGKKCSFFILDGPIKEYFYQKNNTNCETLVKHHESFSKGYIDDSMGLHQILNEDNCHKYSLHYYR